MEGAVVREGVTMGDNNFVGPYCIIGDYPEKAGYFDKLGQVVIAHNNRFTKQVTIDSGTTLKTYIGSHNVFLKNAHVGHDAEVHSYVVLSCNVCIGGHTKVHNGNNFGLGAVVHQRLEIPVGCMFGMNTVVTKKTELTAATKFVGVPARAIGANIRHEKQHAG